MNFIFVDGWRFYSSNGTYLYITEKDLENYKENDLTMDEIKSISYSYLTSDNFFDFSNRNSLYYEF